MKSFLLVAFACCATCLYSISVRAGGLAFDAAGNLFLADSDKHSVFKYTPDGTKSTFAMGLYPLGLCFDREGNLFVSDGAATAAKSRRSIVKFTADGKRSTFATGLEEPRDLTVDATGNVYVSSNYAILRFTPHGTKNTFSSAPGADEAWDLAVDRRPRRSVSMERRKN